MPLVSIIIPTYRRPKYLKRAIDSALNQTYENIEVIVVDDNSEGDIYRLETEVFMSTYTDPRIRYVKHQVNKNGSAARNSGISISKGKYITFLDDDDEYYRDKIMKQVECMESLDDSWVACYTLITRYRNNQFIDRSTDTRGGKIYYDVFKNEVYFNSGSNLFIRNEIVKSINGFDETFMRMQDLEFLIRVAERGSIACVEEYLLKVHLEDRQNVFDANKFTNAIEHFIETFKVRISNLPSNIQKEILLSKNLDLLRLIIYEKKYFFGLQFIIKNKINLNVLVRYVFYIINRKITKTCYGFKF